MFGWCDRVEVFLVVTISSGWLGVTVRCVIALWFSIGWYNNIASRSCISRSRDSLMVASEGVALHYWGLPCRSLGVYSGNDEGYILYRATSQILWIQMPKYRRRSAPSTHTNKLYAGLIDNLKRNTSHQKLESKSTTDFQCYRVPSELHRESLADLQTMSSFVVTAIGSSLTARHAVRQVYVAYVLMVELWNETVQESIALYCEKRELTKSSHALDDSRHRSRVYYLRSLLWVRWTPCMHILGEMTQKLFGAFVIRRRGGTE